MALLPCSWDVSCDICTGFEDYSDTVRDSSLWLASTFLWGATGRQYGVCPVTVYPTQRRGAPIAYRAYPAWPGGDAAYAGWGPFLFSGRWYNAGCGSCCGDRGCAVVLRGPVASVASVMIGEEVIPESAYRVDISGGAYLLVRTDGQCWPVCNNDETPFEVIYGYGIEIPEALSIATALLACEYAKSLAGGACKLPARMTRLSRQGVDLEVEAVADAGARQWETGIREVDVVIASLNPGRRQSPPTVLSPDLQESCDRFPVWSA